MQCKDVELVLEQEGLEPLPEAARAHVAQCSHCQGFLADLETIVSVAVQLPDEVEPPARVWVSLRNQLEHEGIIRETATVEQSTSRWSRLGDLFRSRAFATVTVGLLIAVAGVVELQRTETPAPPPPSPISSEIANIVKQEEIDLRNMHQASTLPEDAVEASLEQNLQQLNDFIADCERHLKEAPQDDLAREYLAAAYQQKADLLAAMMDRGRSVN